MYAKSYWLTYMRTKEKCKIDATQIGDRVNAHTKPLDSAKIQREVLIVVYKYPSGWSILK